MKSVLVIGLGRFGRHLAHKMTELGNDVVVVDEDERLVAQYAQQFSDAQIADCTNAEVLRALGVPHYDICFVAIGEDFQSSLVITSLLKKQGAKQVVCLAKQDIQADLLLQIGADDVVCPERDIADKLAVQYNADNIFDFVELTSEFSIYEIEVPSPWVGHALNELDLRRKYKINVIAIKKDTVLHPMPGPDYVFAANDHLMVMGRSTDMFRVARKA